MGKSKETTFPVKNDKNLHPLSDRARTPKRAPIAESKKERPASKGRVHKGRTHN